MSSVYRNPAVPASTPPDAPPTDFLYEQVAPSTESSGLLHTMRALIGPSFAAGTIALLVNATAGILVGTASAAVLLVRRRRGSGGVVVHVENGLLEVRRPRSREPLARMRLEDLDDVALDTRSERMMHEGASAIPAVAFSESRAGGLIDRSRIVLVRSTSPAPFPLSVERGSHGRNVEALGKLRVFLRKHGWIPADERPAPDAPDALDATAS